MPTTLISSRAKIAISSAAPASCGFFLTWRSSFIRCFFLRFIANSPDSTGGLSRSFPRASSSASRDPVAASSQSTSHLHLECSWANYFYRLANRATVLPAYHSCTEKSAAPGPLETSSGIRRRFDSSGSRDCSQRFSKARCPPSSLVTKRADCPPSSGPHLDRGSGRADRSGKRSSLLADSVG